MNKNNLLDYNQLEALKVMTEKRDQGAYAFIGPDGFCRNEAMIASAWNLPMIAFVRNISISIWVILCR